MEANGRSDTDASVREPLEKKYIDLLLKLAAEPIPPTMFKKPSDKVERTKDKVLYLARMAWVLFREEETKVANSLLEQALAIPIDPTDTNTRRELAGVLAAAGKSEAALEVYKGLDLREEDHRRLLGLYASTRQFTKAEESANALLQLKPDDLDAKRWLADIKLWEAKYPEALAQYLKLLNDNFDKGKDKEKIWSNYLEAASQMEKLSVSEADMAKRVIAKLEPIAKESLLLARMALVLHRHFEEQITLPVLATEARAFLTSPMTGPWPAIAAIVADRARTTIARELLMKAIDNVNKKDPTSLARLAWITYQIGYPTKASQLLDESIALNPKEKNVRREIGNVLVATQRNEQALPWFEKLAAENPKDTELQIRLAEVTVFAEKYTLGLDRVWALLDKDLELKDPALVRLWTTYIDAVSSVKTPMSLPEIELLARISEKPYPPKVKTPDDQLAYNSRMAWGLYREGDRLKSTTWAGKVETLLERGWKLVTPDRDRDYRYEFAGVLGAVKHYKQAIQITRELLKDDPNSYPLRVRLAENLLYSGGLEGVPKREQETLAAESMEILQGLLTEDFRRPQLWKTFIDASSIVPRLNPPEIAMALHLANEPIKFKDPGEEIDYLTRLPGPSRAKVAERKTSSGWPARTRCWTKLSSWSPTIRSAVPWPEFSPLPKKLRLPSP